MKGIYINPLTKTIEYMAVDDFYLMKEILGCSLAEKITISQTPPLDLWLDEEGRLKSDRRGKYFTFTSPENNTINGFNTFVGPAFVMGTKFTEEGAEMASPSIDVEEIRDRIIWLPDYEDEPVMEFIPNEKLN